MKIMSNSSLPTSNMSPIVASRSMREILAGIAGGTIVTRKQHSEERERETDNLE